MKAVKNVLAGLLAVSVLLLVGCPSPFGDVQEVSGYETSATIDIDRMVFVEEDGTETPLLSPENGGPDEIVDYAVVADSGSARHTDADDSVRVVVLGRRNGRIAIWVMYRHGGMVVLSNEDGDESDLLEMIEAESWGLEGWEYDARALSDDGKVVIGQFFRPDGWEFAEKLGDVPEPAIGVWWNIYETDDSYVVSRAHPMLMMEEPAESLARCSTGNEDRKYWRDRFRRYVIELLASAILDSSWNFMADVEDFVDPEDVDGLIPEGFYVAKGTDRNGVASRVWFTADSMEDIVEAPADTPDDPQDPDNRAPWAVAGTDDSWTYLTVGGEFYLQVFNEDLQQLVSLDPAASNYGAGDPDVDDIVTYRFELGSESQIPETPPTVEITSDGLFRIVDWNSPGGSYNLYFEIYASDGNHPETPPLSPVQITLY